MWRNKAAERWSPDEEEAAFHQAVGPGYVANIVEARSAADDAALAAAVDAAVANYFGRSPVGASAVDVGAAEGWATKRLRELGFDAIGVERSPTIAEHAEAGRVLVGNAEALPIEDASRDFVICNSIFEHVLHPDQVVSEISRVLKPGGVAMLSTTNQWNPRTGEIGVLFFPWMPYWLRDRLWRRSGRGHISPHYFSYGDLRRMGRRHGLEVETAITVALRGRRGKTLFGKAAGVAYRVPGVRFLMEAVMPVVKVRMVKPLT